MFVLKIEEKNCHVPNYNVAPICLVICLPACAFEQSTIASIDRMHRATIIKQGRSLKGEGGQGEQLTCPPPQNFPKFKKFLGENPPPLPDKIPRLRACYIMYAER